MEIKTYSQDSLTIIELIGSLDGTTSSAAQDKLLPLVQAGCRLVFDMKECSYVSSAGLRVLLMLGKQLKSVGGQGVFAGLAEEVKEVMNMTGFNNIFKSYDTLLKAKDAVR